MGGKIVLVILAIAVIGIGAYAAMTMMENSQPHEATIEIEFKNDTSGNQFYQVIFDSGPVFNYTISPGITKKIVTYEWEGEKSHYVKMKFIRNSSATFTKAVTVQDGKTYKVTV